MPPSDKNDQIPDSPALSDSSHFRSPNLVSPDIIVRRRSRSKDPDPDPIIIPLTENVENIDPRLPGAKVHTRKRDHVHVKFVEIEEVHFEKQKIFKIDSLPVLEIERDYFSLFNPCAVLDYEQLISGWGWQPLKPILCKKWFFYNIIKFLEQV